jgi:hypothetical protein
LKREKPDGELAFQPAKSVHGSVLDQAAVGFRAFAENGEKGTESQMSGAERYRKGTVRYQTKALVGDSVGKLREKYLLVFGHQSRSNHKQFLVRRIAWWLQANAQGERAGSGPCCWPKTPI